MAKALSKTTDALWENWFKGVDVAFESCKQMEQAILENLNLQQQHLAQCAENTERLKEELTRQIKQFREATKREVQPLIGEEMSQQVTKWLEQFDEISDRLIQLAFTPTNELNSTSRLLHDQTASLLKQYLSQQQLGRDEAKRLFKSYLEKLKETQKAFVEKANESPFFQ